jgi:hypothetical protein
MKTEEEIRRNLTEILESKIPLDEHMKGYVKALQWVLKEQNQQTT